jgi:hypothetical protein
MLDKSKLGTRFVCFECGTKFYDLNRADPLCPECNADQRNKPVRTMRELLKGGKSRSLLVDDDIPAKDDEDEDDETLGLLDDADDDDDDADEDEDEDDE